MKTLDLYNAMEKILPESLCCGWDNDGISVLPSKDHVSRKILIALDADIPTIEYAKENGFDTIITHHPLIFRPINEIAGTGAVSQRAIELLKADIAHIGFHTRFDAADGGTNDVLCELIGIKDAVRFGSVGEEIGRIGEIGGMSFEDFCKKITEIFGKAHFSASKAGDVVKKVAVCSGSGSGMTLPAAAAGADVLLTGELHYHEALDARDLGLSVVCAGHYETEAPALEALAKTVGETGDFITEIFTEKQYAV